MRSDRWRWMVTALTVLALALIGAGCGDDDEESATTGAGAGSAAAKKFPADTTMGRIQQKGEIVVGVKYDVPPFGFKNPRSGAI